MLEKGRFLGYLELLQNHLKPKSPPLDLLGTNPI